jgi:hypothetical protein
MNGGQYTIGLALSRNLCRLGESLRPSASAWAGSRVGSSLHERILTPPPLAGLHVCRLNLRPSSFVSVVVLSPLDPPPLLSRRVGHMSDHMHVYMTLMMVGDVVGGQISDGVGLGLSSESGSGVATVLVVVSGSESETASGSM